MPRGSSRVDATSAGPERAASDGRPWPGRAEMAWAWVAGLVLGFHLGVTVTSPLIFSRFGMCAGVRRAPRPLVARSALGDGGTA